MIFPQLARFTDVALLLLRVMVGIVFITSEWNHLEKARGTEQRYRDEQRLDDFSRRCRSRRRSRGGVGRSHATRRRGFDLANARRDSEKDFRLAHRLLG